MVRKLKCGVCVGVCVGVWVCVCVSKERPSWFGRGSGKIFSERGECCEQVSSRKGSGRLSERRRGGEEVGVRAPCLEWLRETTAALTAGLILLRKKVQGINTKENESVLRWESERQTCCKVNEPSLSHLERRFHSFACSSQLSSTLLRLEGLFVLTLFFSIGTTTLTQVGQLRGGVGDGQRKYWQEKRSPPEPETGSSSARLRWFVDSQLLKRASHLAPAQSAREQSGRALRLLFLFIISSLSHANANNLCRGCLQKKTDWSHLSRCNQLRYLDVHNTVSLCTF